MNGLPQVTRLAIDPATGIAPQPWLGGPSNHLGTVVVARTDFQDFSGEDWSVRYLPLRLRFDVFQCAVLHLISAE